MDKRDPLYSDIESYIQNSFLSLWRKNNN